VIEVPAAALTELADLAARPGHDPRGDRALDALGLLRSLGVAVAVEAFGRPGTDLAALRRLPLSAVKLDGGLSGELGHAEAVPRAVVQLCRALDLRVVMTGVTSTAQLNGARRVGADAVQGPAVARPMSAEDVTNLLTLRLPREFRLS
jgi:EAL domain-containing protein (putative c-di-GMP-specific phosphodiesterase class I)